MDLPKTKKGIVYGIESYTDSLGFRVPAEDIGREYRNSEKETILIVGDSVAFGNGVQEKQTMAGLLRTSFPNIQIHNAAVPGFDLKDYADVTHNLVSTLPNIKAIFLIYCLNDVYLDSASELQKQLNKSENKKDSD